MVNVSSVAGRLGMRAIVESKTADPDPFDQRDGGHVAERFPPITASSR